MRPDKPDSSGWYILRKRKKIRRKRYFNFMIVPYPTASVRSFRCPTWVIKGIFVLSILSLGVSAYFIYTYNNLMKEASHLQVVKRINEVQEHKIEELEEMTAEVQSRVQELNALDQKVREMVGLEERTDTLPTRTDSGSRGGGSRSLLDSVKASDTDEGDDSTGAAFQDPKEENGLQRLEDLEFQLQDLDQRLEDEKENLEKLQGEVEDRLAFLEAYPSRWPVSGRITSTFGYRKSPFGRGTEFHDGLDIANSYGTRIRAAGKGAVIKVGWVPGYGRMAVINHGYGYKTYYAHCSNIYVEVGESVNKGEVIAAIGNTGRTTGPHLHFGVSYQGKIIDPLKVLK